jgi:hypothetical protein
MFTFEVAIPADLSSGKIRQRFADFKKYGFYNVGDNVLNLYLLGIKGIDPGDILEGWPKNVNPNYIQTPYVHVAQRVYHYYDKILLPNRAEWYLRLDEDSITDVSTLAKFLTRDYDHRREYHLTGQLNHDIYNLDRTLLTMLGYGHWYHPHDNHNYFDAPQHEVEIGVSSNAAIQKLYSCTQSMKYFSMRKEFPEGWGDHGVTHAMRIAKVYALVAKFLTHQAEIVNFTRFGGQRAHIHWISRDRTPKIMTWLETFEEEQFADVKNASYFLGKPGNPKKIINFGEDYCIRTIQCINHESEGEPIGLWCKLGDKLAIYSEDKGEDIGMFERGEDGRWTWKELELVKITA